MTTPPAAPPPDPEQVFSRGSRLVLLLALLLVGLSAAELLYRLAQPTDGWYTETNPDDALVLDFNMLGDASPLQRADLVLKIGGQSPDLAAANRGLFTSALPPNWVVGATVPYQVLRAGQVLTVDVPLAHWRAGPVLANSVNPFLVAVLLQAGVATLAFARRPGSWGARALLFLSASLVATLISSVLTQTFDILLPSRPIIILFSFLSWAVFIWPSFFVLTLSFPRPKRFFARRPWLVLAAVYGAVPLLMALTGELGIGWTLVIVWAAFSLLAVANSALTVRDPVGRVQLRWAAAGITLGALGIITNNVISLGLSAGWLQFSESTSRLSEELPFTIAIMAPAMGLAIAILRYRLFDIDVILRRTLLYAALTGLLALVYFGSVVVLEAVLRPFSGQSQSQVVTVLSTLAIAALFVPLRRRVQAFIDRRFFRRKYDAARTLAAFGAAVRDETNLETLRGHLLSVIDETMQPESVGLWLRPSAERRPGRQG